MQGMDSHRPPAPPSLPAFAASPAEGRVFAASCVVRSTDVTPDGRLRFDALARYLQDAAEDDLADSGWDEPSYWLLRRVEVAVRRYPARREVLRLSTFCSALGPRWAERTTTVSGPGGDLIQARAVWVAIGRADGRPAPLGAAFHRLYGPSAGGRRVSARLSHPGPPDPHSGPSESEPGRPHGGTWPLRATDFDLAGHVNNSVHWAAVEEVLAGPAAGWRPDRAEFEYARPIEPGHDPELVISRTRDELRLWLLGGTQTLASARLTRGPTPD
jgi:acyl-ACP thioesterase